MDAREIRKLKPEPTHYLNRFAGCFARKDTRTHMPVYAEEQLSDLPRKSVESIDLAAWKPVRTLQEFLAQLLWDEDALRRRVQEIGVDEHAWFFIPGFSRS
jgi:SRSO17 transposase